MGMEQVLSLILGLIIVIEAVLLFVGMYILSPKPNEWNTRLNTSALVLDITFGLIIVLNSVEKNQFIEVAVLGLLATHLYREIEYFFKSKADRFIINFPLFIVNSVKILGLLGLLLLVF